MNNNNVSLQAQVHGSKIPCTQFLKQWNEKQKAKYLHTNKKITERENEVQIGSEKNEEY